MAFLIPSTACNHCASLSWATIVQYDTWTTWVSEIPVGIGGNWWLSDMPGELGHLALASGTARLTMTYCLAFG